MAAFQATGVAIYLEMAENIAKLIINQHARAANWRVPEHFNAKWRVDYEYDAIQCSAQQAAPPAMRWSGAGCWWSCIICVSGAIAGCRPPQKRCFSTHESWVGTKNRAGSIIRLIGKTAHCKHFACGGPVRKRLPRPTFYEKSATIRRSRSGTVGSGNLSPLI